VPSLAYSTTTKMNNKRASRKAQMRKANTRSVKRLVKQNVRNNNRKQQRGDTREIPTVVANIVRGMQPRQSVAVLEGKEIMGYIRVGPTTQTGLGGTQLMNPLVLTCEQLRKFVAIYGQYKFRKMQFIVHGNLPTTVGGILYLGYSRNPDLTIPTGQDAPTAISSMENSMAVSVWSTSSFAPNVATNEWYNVDDDSTEVMKTTQGVLFIAQGGLYNITSSAEIPIYLDYVIETRGQQVQPVNQARAVVYPSGSFEIESVDPQTKRTYWEHQLASGETVPYPALIFDAPYFISPQIAVPTLDGKTETALIMSATNGPRTPPGAAYNICFFSSLEAFNSNTTIDSKGTTANIQVGRFTLEAIDPAIISLYSSLAGMPQTQNTPVFVSKRSAYSKPDPWGNPNSRMWL